MKRLTQAVFGFLPLLFGVLLCVGVFSACQQPKPDADLLQRITEQGKLVAGVKFDSKPFGYLDADGELKGFDVDLVREISARLAKKLGTPVEVEFQQVVSSTRQIALDSRHVDLVAATMTITDERKKVIDFSEPYFTAHQKIIVPDKSTARTLDDLNNDTVLFVFGSTSEENIKKRLPQANYLGFKAYTDAFSALRAGRGDAFTTDDTILGGFLAENCGFRLLDEKLSDEPYGIGFKKSSVTKALQKQINEIILEMNADGTLKKLRAQWVDGVRNGKACR